MNYNKAAIRIAVQQVVKPHLILRLDFLISTAGEQTDDFQKCVSKIKTEREIVSFDLPLTRKLMEPETFIL